MLPQEIQSRIDDLAARCRRLLILRGTGVVALLMGGAALATFLADYLLRLPLGLRAVTLVAIVGLIGLVTVRALWLPLRMGASRDDLALRIEARHPELKDSLISAVQFSRQVEAEGFYQSKELARLVIEKGRDSIQGVDLALVAPGGRTYRVFGSAAGAVVLLTLLSIWSPYHAVTWFQRTCLLQDVEWRKSVILEVHLPDGGVTIARGEDITVKVAVVKGDPDQVIIHSRNSSRSRWESRPMVRHRREGTGGETWVHTYHEVPEDFRLYVTGGDARTEIYPISVKVPPSIQEISLTVSYPTYLSRPDETIPDGNLRAPVGSRVSFRSETNRSLSKAALVMGDASVPIEATDGPRGDRTVLEGSFIVERSLWYRFDLTDVDGFANSRPIRFRLRAVPDRPPVLKVLSPGRNIAVSDKAVVPMEVEIADDHGIRSARLRYTISSGYEGEGEEELLPIAVPAEPTQSMRATLPFDLSTLSVKLGDQVRYVFEADDFLEFGQPRSGHSPSYTLLIVSPADIESDLDSRLQKVRDQVRRTIRAQRQTQEATVSVSRSAEASSDAHRPALVQAELDQKKVGQAVARSVRQLGGVASDMRWNRVGEERDLEWIEGLMEMLTEGAIARSDSAAERLARARQEKDLSLLLPVPGTQEEVIAVLERVWRSLDKWTDFREMVRRIRELKDEEERIREVIQSLVPGDGR